MRYSVALFLLFLCACGDNAPALDSSQADTAPDGIELPTVGILGALPPTEGRVTIVVDAAGVLTIDGTSCPWDELGQRLSDITATLGTRPIRVSMTAELVEENTEETEEDTEEVHEQEVVAEEPVIKDEEIIEEVGTELPAESWSPESLIAARSPTPRGSAVTALDGSRNADVLLRIDRRVPWSVVAHVLMTGVHPDRRLWRMFFAASGADGRGEGAIAVFLPKDHGCPREGRSLDHVRVKLRSKKGAGDISREVLASDIRRRMSTPRTLLTVELVGRSQTPYGDMLTAMDSALRAGALRLFMAGHARQEGDPASWCAAASESGPFHWEVSGEALMGAPAVPAAGPHRSTGYAGVVNEIMIEEDFAEEVEDK